MMKRFQIGEMIGEYRVTGFLGAGGMGEVYAGVHEKLGRPAAIKVLGEAATADATFKTRFFNEARLQANLHHPNIATLYDFHEKGDQLFIFMELVDGESLEDLIKRRSFSIEETLKVFVAVCEAVAYIHRNGIIHRDIKSQNVKLNSAGQVKLLDFGIAKDSSNPAHSLTQTGGVIGTPHYLAPEQLEGKPASPQTDVWALGVLLYEMLTGDVPFQSDSLAGLVLQISQVKFASPEDINPAVPREVSGIVRKCLKAGAADRYQTADDLARAVKNILNKEQSQTAGFFRSRKSPPFESSGESLNLPRTVVSETRNPKSDLPSFHDHSNGAKRNFPFMAAAAGLGLVGILVVSLAGFVVWAMSGSSESEKTTAAETKNKNVVIAQSAKSTGLSKRVQIDVDEGKAEVLRDGQKLGTTPFDMEANEGEKIDLTLRREGFEDKAVQLEITGSKKVYTFQMKPK